MKLALWNKLSYNEKQRFFDLGGSFDLLYWLAVFCEAFAEYG